MSTKEERLTAALADYRNGIFKSIRDAAGAHAVPKSTLQRWATGGRKAGEAQSNRQRFTPAQEERLANWILSEASRGFAPSHRRVHEMMACLVGPREEPLGKNWIYAFLTRNPSVKPAIGRPIDRLRVNGATPDRIREFFDRFLVLRTKFQVKTANIWNADETGLALGVCESRTVLAGVQQGPVVLKIPQTREWVTVVEAISAAGEVSRPLVIFKGKFAQTTYFPEDIPDWQFTMSEKGWTSDEKALRWVEACFEPATRPERGEHRILIVDGHGSHISTDFRFACWTYDIHLLYLPSHTSHVLQPLDVSCFSVLKRSYRNKIAELASLDDAAPVKKQRFIEYYKEARRDAFTSLVIRGGFSGSGISPFNPAKVLESPLILRPQNPALPRPETPPQAETQPEVTFKTPHHPRDIQYATRVLTAGESLSRDLRMYLQKASKGFDEIVAEVTALRLENIELKRKLEASQAQSRRKRRRILNPNDDLLAMEDIFIARSTFDAESARALRRRLAGSLLAAVEINGSNN